MIEHVHTNKIWSSIGLPVSHICRSDLDPGPRPWSPKSRLCLIRDPPRPTRFTFSYSDREFFRSLLYLRALLCTALFYTLFSFKKNL